MTDIQDSELKGAGLVQEQGLSRQKIMSKLDGVDSIHEMFHNPITPLNQGSSVEFNICPAGDTFIDLPSTRLYGRAKIVKIVNNVATKTVAADDFSVVNLLPQMIWKMISLKLNGIEVQRNSTYLYWMKSFLETLFSCSNVQKAYFLKHSSMWYSDLSGKEEINATETGNDTKSGYKNRRAVVTTSKAFEFCIPLHVDLLNGATKLLPPGVIMNLVLHQNEEALFMLAANDSTTYRIVFENLQLVTKNVILTDVAKNAFSMRLTREPWQVTYPQGLVATHTIMSGTTSTYVPNLASGILPHAIICSFVLADAIQGDITLNPLHMQHFKTKEFYFRVNGKPKPMRSWKPDFPGNYALREYLALIKGLSLDKGDIVPISYNEFLTGMTFFVLDLSGELSSLRSSHKDRFGSMDAFIAFEESLAKNINLITYSIYDSSVSIDKDRTVTCEM